MSTRATAGSSGQSLSILVQPVPTTAAARCLLCPVPRVVLPGMGNVKRKRPKLAALGIKPVRTAEKNTRFLWRADVAGSGDAAAGADQVHIHLAGNGFLYRYAVHIQLSNAWHTADNEDSRPLTESLASCF